MPPASNQSRSPDPLKAGLAGGQYGAVQFIALAAIAALIAILRPGRRSARTAEVKAESRSSRR